MRFCALLPVFDPGVYRVDSRPRFLRVREAFEGDHDLDQRRE
jgi:hypothetical protein